MHVSHEKLWKIEDLSKIFRETELDPAKASNLSGSASPEGRALLSELESLTHDELLDVAGIVWMGYSDFASFNHARGHSRGMDDEQIAGYLFEKPLHEYIPKGLHAIAKLAATKNFERADDDYADEVKEKDDDL
jgi:hypothetical protein